MSARSLVLRRTVWRGRGSWQPRAADAWQSPVALLGRRFAAGEMDEDEPWRRLAVLTESKRGAG